MVELRAQWLKYCKKKKMFRKTEPLRSSKSPVRRQLKYTVALGCLTNSPETLAAQNKGVSQHTAAGRSGNSQLRLPVQAYHVLAEFHYSLKLFSLNA